MTVYVEINGVKYPAVITGRLNDSDWDDRASKAITLEMSYEDAMRNFVDGVSWSIIQEVEDTEEQINENGEVTFVPTIKLESYDNSEYSLAGDITDHRDGTITVKMGKLTDLEEAYEIILGGI
jgi:hypothetical protein